MRDNDDSEKNDTIDYYSIHVENVSKMMMNVVMDENLLYFHWVMNDGTKFDEISNIHDHFHDPMIVVDDVYVSSYSMMIDVENRRELLHCLEKKIQEKYFLITIDDDDTTRDHENLCDDDDDDDVNST